MYEEPKKIIMKGWKSNFILEPRPPYTHYYLWFPELDRTELVRIGQRYKVMRDEDNPVEVDEDHDGNENLYIEECEECHACGEWFTEDENNMAEYDKGEFYCEDCANHLINCPTCNTLFVPNDDYPETCEHCDGKEKED